MVPDEGDVWVKDISQTEILIFWQPIQSASGYYLTAIGQFTGDQVDQEVNIGTDSYEFEDLLAGERYTVTVTGIGVNRGGSVQQRTCK